MTRARANVMLRLVAIGCAWIAASAQIETVRAAESVVPRVLLLHSADVMLPASMRQDRMTRSAIQAAVDGPVDFYSESFDSYRMPGVSKEERFLQYLRDKYTSRPPNLIVTHGPMHELMSRHRRELWPSAPLMMVDVGAHRVRAGAVPAGVPYTSSELDMAGTLELALRLHPDARRVIVVAGVAPYDLDAHARALQEFKQFQSRVEIESLVGLTEAELTQKLSQLGPDAVVFQMSVMLDAAGNGYVGAELGRRLAAVSTAPVYTYFDIGMGLGLVGGMLMNRDGQSAHIGEIARRLLSGEPQQSVPIPPAAQSVCTLDWRALERWQIDKSLIPSDCQIKFVPPSFWERHGTTVIASALALATLAALLAAWHIQRRRRLAEQEALLRTSELAHAARLGAAGSLMASITHEISQPLMSILTNAAAGERMIASGRADLDEIRSILADIRADDARAGAIISHLRELLKKREVSMERVAINEVVSKALKILESAARRQQVTVVTQLDDTLGVVMADPVHLQQVVLNLAMNGIEAMSDQPPHARTLTVRTARDSKGAAEVSVNDTGCGIPQERLTQLFEPFFTTKADGMGVGLSIARTLVQAHGGSIRAESAGPGGGATMRFTIPIAAERSSALERAAVS